MSRVRSSVSLGSKKRSMERLGLRESRGTKYRKISPLRCRLKRRVEVPDNIFVSGIRLEIPGKSWPNA